MSIVGWYQDMALVRSRGQCVDKATTLGELHCRRQETQGQFFTPEPVARLMWDMGHAALGARDDALPISVFDPAIGSGRLVQFADNGHVVYGCDIDSALITALGERLTASGVRSVLRDGSMANKRALCMDLALLNPPFSLHLESPHLEPFECVSFGRFGPKSSAQSHWYALYQAHQAARVTVALLPRTCVNELEAHPRLARHVRSIVDLPDSTFVDEGARVATAIVLFVKAPHVGAPIRVRGLDAARSAFRSLVPQSAPEPVWLRPTFEDCEISDSSPVFTGPVTGDVRIRIDRSGRRVKLGFRCALVEARAMNMVLVRRLGLDNHKGTRLPKGVQFAGDGKLLIEGLLTGKGPTDRIEALCEILRSAGGVPEPTRDLLGYLHRRWRRLRVEKTPLQRTIFDPDGRHDPGGMNGARCTAVRAHFPDPANLMTGAIPAGAVVVLERAEDSDAERYRYVGMPNMPAVSIQKLREHLSIPKSASAESGWRQIEAGRAAAFPLQAAALSRRLTAAGGDSFLGSWPFQREDVIELCMTRGVVAGHMMALGKSRIAVGVCLLGGRHNAIIVESGLIDEMLAQFKSFGLPEHLYKVIAGPQDVADLRRINLVSYKRLRDPIRPGTRRTLAALLRRRFHTVCADEGSLLAHTDTLQTQALYRLSPRRRVALDGTPIANLPRNLLPLVAWTSGDGTESQPYGVRHPFVCPDLFTSGALAERGIDRFREEFVVTEWVTHQFADGMQSGAKREIPSLNNLDLYREFVGRHVLRRVRKEPAVQPYLRIEDPDTSIETVDWDTAHLKFYVDVAEQFVDWYRSVRSDLAARKLNLVVVLLRLSAACRAASIPQDLKGPVRWPGGLTSKQRRCAELLGDLEDCQATTLTYFESPVAAEIIAGQLRAQGREVVVYTGLHSPTKRTRALNDQFRSGRVRNALLTYGVGARGLNLPEASHCVFYDRMWGARQEAQAQDRAQRAGRRGRLQALYLHLAGSTDEYRAQMVAFKSDTANAGLDFAEPEFRPDEYEHWLTMLDRFCESIGRSRLELRNRIKCAA